jgi:hypothetical protein
MVAPVFVGASTVYNASNVWPSTLTFGTSDLPAGSAVDDRMVLIVTSYYVQRVIAPVEPTLQQFGGISGWTDLGRVTAQTSGSSVDTFTEMWAYTTRRTAATFPLTIQPQTSDGSPITPNASSGQRFYRVSVAAWSPSAGFRTGASQEGGAARNDTLSSTSSLSVNGVGSGIFAQVNFVQFGDMGAVSSANGYTVRYTQPAVSLYGGSLTISDKSFTSSGASSQIVFNKPTGNFGLAINFALDVAEAGGWSVGQIKY